MKPAPLAALAGIAAVAATTGVLFAATSASATKCPPPGEITVGDRTISTCVVIFPGCDPRPCDPTAAAPQE